MAVDIKVAPDEKLELVQTYVTDTNPNSDYFVISELPDTFSGGKNAFLIAGSDKLLSNTEIKIQVRDAAGNVCYIEFSNGLPTEYYEGNSKVVAVYVYPTLTAFGPATITILGQLKDTPPEWNGLYSVKWQRQVNINPALANTTRVRLYKRPAVSIKELLQPLYSIVSGSKVASLVTQSFASITVNQLETFAGDVKRVKVYRTSAGDISDYELIQDISIEAKNLLTTYALSGSVVGNAGLFGPDSLSKVWNTGSLYATLNSTYVTDGLELTGSGYFKYTSSLNLLSSNTYELELDTFYTGSTATNLVAYISGTQNGVIPITTFSGSTPTKNFGTTTIPFTIPNDEPTASLYLSQSSGINQWHVGNISLNLSQDTAFSPNEVSFITSMPTVLGNETFNFKFELYDVNNNYVPVAVTASALFNGGNNNIGGTLLIVSSSTSASNAYTSASILALSQSVSGTIGIVTGSVSFVSTSVSSSLSQSFGATAAASASLQSSSLYISASVSGTISNVSQSASSSLSLVSQSVSKSIASISASAASASNFNYAYTTYLDGNIFTDSTGKLIKTPATSSTQNGLYTGQQYLGFYSGSSWKTYMANNGNFYLTSSVAGGGFMAWNAAAANLAIAGNITILGGDAATTASVTTAVNNGTASLSQSLAPNIFTDSNGKIVRPPTNPASNYGLFLASDHLGFYSASATDGGTWKTYMDNSGKFYLTGSASNYLKWDGSVLTIAGAINIVGGQAATDIANAASSGSNALSYAVANNATASAAAASQAATAASTAANYALINANTSSISAAATAAGFALINANTASIFTDSTGKINKTPATGSQTGLFLGDSYLGYYNGSNWKTYMQNNGNFYLSGTNGYLSWNAGADTLGIKGDIIATNITATTTGNIAGWNIDGSRFYKSVTNVGLLEIKSSDNTISMYDTANNLKLQINPTNTQPTITIPSNTTTIGAVQGTFKIPPGVYTNSQYYSETVASFTLTGALNEVFVDDIGPKFYDSALSAADNAMNYFGNYWRYLKVQGVKYYLYLQLINQSTGQARQYTIAYIQCDLPYNPADGASNYKNGSLTTSPALFSNLAAGNYTLGLIHYAEATQIANPYVPSSPGDGITVYPWTSTQNGVLNVTYGSSNAYSVLNAGGLSLYQGSQNYVKAVSPGSGTDAYFTVKGRTSFINSVTIGGTLNANFKQFQITHPLDKNKWLFHSAIEAPRADLIYRGTIELLNGSGSVNIDSQSKMMDGTFVALTKNRQLFLQNNVSFDKVIGTIDGAIVNVICENKNSNDKIGWMVVAERNDTEILASKLYNTSGSYIPERYKDSVFTENYTIDSGSI